MRFLLDASLPRSAAGVLQRHGHDVTDVRDIGLGTAADASIAAHARDTQSTLVTRDFDFADTRNYPPVQHSGIVVLQLAEHATVAQVLDLLEAFARQREVLVRLNGQLAIVETWRIRMRSS